MLDEEGEEDEDIANFGANLFESDLISLLHQIPFNKLFQQILFIQYEDDKYYQNKNLITDHHMIRIFAFSTIIVKLLNKGLKTYDSPRYRQLAKRLSALIRDIVQYVSDQWEVFDKSQVRKYFCTSFIRSDNILIFYVIIFLHFFYWKGGRFINIVEITN